ncbi:nitrogenase cofactor biosynthesis protein NifB [Klebsiella variicola]|uniref:Nitrogenase cofactor biosynthesis protein NifB n=1 Tax=Klebsiella variicola TaxID=244366 RepID=A0A7H4MNI9_KLEVA|nr:nitrogenase cofactor biosynthesis protein NifB [Klebsiella variicola]
MTRTFRTLELVRDQLPDLKLCLSTNGLMLPDAVDRLLEVGVDHVTVTINTLDADIAGQIYAWLWLDGERYCGREAGEILIARQLEGVRRLTAAGVLVKINSVLIPGINDGGMAEVGRRLRESGAFIHNIMPLIARPEHGTVFGLNGQPEPDAGMLAAIRSQCGEVMPQMTHCHQCRADAIGMLGEDRSQQFTRLPDPDSLPDWLPILHQRAELHASLATQGESDADDACLVAVASRHGEVIDCHFGHADRFSIYSLSAASMVLVGERFTPKYCRGEEECEPQENEARLAALLALLADVKAVFCVRIGHTPWQQLELQALSRRWTARGVRSPRCCLPGGSGGARAWRHRVCVRGSPDGAGRLVDPPVAIVSRRKRLLSAADGADSRSVAGAATAAGRGGDAAGQRDAEPPSADDRAECHPRRRASAAGAVADGVDGAGG